MTKKNKEINKAEKLLKLRLEKQIRCGDGSGFRSDEINKSHSINCNCEYLDREISKLEQYL